MPDLQALLDQIDRLDQQATPGPWVHDEHDTNPNMDSIVSTALGDLRWIEVARSINHDTEFIALARTALPAISKALRAVLELLDDYAMPGKLHDPTGIAGAELETLEGYIREAITDAMEDQ